MAPAAPAGGRGSPSHLTPVPAEKAVRRGVTRDRLRFDQPSELKVYEAISRVQAQLDPFDTIAIAANVSLRVLGHTFMIDLLVVYRGQSWAIEVDGASHVGKWSSDRSRDELIEDCGIRVFHVDVRDTEDPGTLDAHVRRFLTRLRMPAGTSQT